MSLPDYIPNAKVFMVIKTYPNLSKKHGELVCTAGIYQDQFVRIYPIKFRDLEEYRQFKKYQWINVTLRKRPPQKDCRLESYSPEGDIQLLEHIGHSQKNFWQKRMNIINNVPIHRNLKLLIEKAKVAPYPSLAILKPSKILNFKIEPTDRDWSPQQKAFFNQPDMFEQIKPLTLKKLPYKYSYCFQTEDGLERTAMIEDWEIGALYWKCLKNCDGNEREANLKVQEKYLDIAKNKNVFFFMGTSLANQIRSPNPFIIIGIGNPNIDITKQQQEFAF